MNQISEHANDIGNVTNSGLKINGVPQNGNELGNINRGNVDNNNNVESNNNDSIHKYNSYISNRSNNTVNHMNDHHIYNPMYNLKFPYVNNDILNYNYNLANYQNYNYDKTNKNMFKRYPNFIPNNFPQYNNMHMYPGFNSYPMNYQTGQGAPILKSNFSNEANEIVETNASNVATATVNNNNDNSVGNGLETISKMNDDSNLNRIMNMNNEIIKNDDKLYGDVQTSVKINEDSIKLSNENEKIGDQNVISSGDVINNQVNLSVENSSKNVDGNGI